MRQKNNPSRSGIADALADDGFKAEGATDAVSFFDNGDRNQPAQLVTVVQGNRWYEAIALAKAMTLSRSFLSLHWTISPHWINSTKASSLSHGDITEILRKPVIFSIQKKRASRIMRSTKHPYKLHA